MAVLLDTYPAFMATHLLDRSGGNTEHGCQLLVRERRSPDQLDIGGCQLGDPRTPNILGLGHTFKVGWVHARPDGAQVVDLHPRSNGADLLFINGSMHKPRLALELDVAVSALRRSATPNPTGSREPAIFNSPQFICQTRSALVVVMTADVSDWFSLDVSSSGVVLSRKWGTPTATAHAKPARIQFGQHSQTLTYRGVARV